MATKIKTQPFIVIMEDTEAIAKDIWLKERKPAVCASDYPAIVGLSGFKNAVDIYEDKINPDDIEDEITLADKYRFGIGHALESVMHEAIANEIGAIPVRDKRMVESTLFPYMRVDIDGLFIIQQDCIICGREFTKGEVVLFEGKTCAYKKFLDYRESPSPDHVAQSKFGMVVRGISACIIGYSCGGNNLSRDLVYHVCECTDEDREIIPMVVKDFWEEHILKEIPPVEALGPYASSFKKSLIRYYGKTAKNNNQMMKFPAQASEALKKSIAVRAEITALNHDVSMKEAERDAIEAPLIALLGTEYQHGVLESIYTTYKAGFSVTDKMVLLSSNMTQLQTEFPEMYQKLVDAGIITNSITRSFSVRAKRKKATTQRQRK